MPREPQTTGMECWLYDLEPVGGGAPRHLRLEHPLDVKEWIARDPKRYCLAPPEGANMVDPHAESAVAAPDPYSVLAGLLTLITDAPTFGARIRELKETLAAIDAGQAKLAADRLAFDEHEKAVRADLDAQERGAQ